MAKTLTDTHKLLTLILSEIGNINHEHLLFLENSQDWEGWYSGLERKATEFRIATREMVHNLLGKLQYKEDQVERLNNLVEAKPGFLDQLTGLDKIEDIKSNLIDISLICGKDSETRIAQNIIDEPVRVNLTKK